jgi:tetratricopeptide (TPR) repeat protein
MNDDIGKYQTYAAGLLRNPDDPDMLVAQFAHLLNTADRRDVKRHFPLARRAWRTAPQRYSVAFNYATALNATGAHAEAIELFRWCVEHAPDSEWRTRAYHHLGIAYCYNGNDAQAIEWYRKALEHGDNPEIRQDLALRLLASGKLNEGLREFECRRQCTEAGLKQNPLKNVGLLPKHLWEKHWQGEDLTGKSIVVYHEEGIGDFFMMCRFIPLLRKFNPAKILLTGKMPDVLELVADHIAVDGIVPLASFDCDYVVGSMTVPWRCGVDYADVDGRPYFKVEPKSFGDRGELHVGLVWRGNPAFQRNSHRSMQFADFTPLLEIPGIAFYSLQVGDGRREITALGYDGLVGDLAPFAKTWRDTARIIASLDALVTVDTACAHLAGALGTPAFVLLTKACDWRWSRKSTHTVWYDSLRTLRQSVQDDWAAVVTMAEMNLEDMLHGRRQNTGADQQGQASDPAVAAVEIGGRKHERVAEKTPAYMRHQPGRTDPHGDCAY